MQGQYAESVGCERQGQSLGELPPYERRPA